MATATVVEFAGLPGAGKSFLASELGEGLAARGVVVTVMARASLRPGRRLRLLGAFALRHPRFAYRTARALAPTRRNTTQAVRLWINWLTSRALVEWAGRQPGITILDQGPVQLLWSIGMRTGPEVLARCGAVHAAEAIPTVLVLVAAPAELARERLQAQGRDDAPPDSQPGRGEAVLESVVAFWDGTATHTVDNRGQIPVVEVLRPVVAALSIPQPPRLS